MKVIWSVVRGRTYCQTSLFLDAKSVIADEYFRNLSRSRIVCGNAIGGGCLRRVEQRSYIPEP